MSAGEEEAESESVFEGLVYWKATRTSTTVVTSQQARSMYVQQITICLQHWYDITAEDNAWGADWERRYNSLRINGQCTNIETGYVPSQAIPLITVDLACEEVVDNDGNAVVEYKMAAQLPLHPLIDSNTYKLTFGSDVSF